MKNDFQKEDYQGENPFATPRFAGFPLDPLSENSHSVAAQGGEMAHWGARTRQIGTFPVNRENISPAQNAGLPEGSGPLGVAPTCIVSLGALDTLRFCVMHVRRARSTFLHKKRGPEMFPLPSSPRTRCGAKKIIFV